MGNAPTGVKVISVLYYIAAIVFLILGIGLIIGSSSIGESFPMFEVLAGFLIIGGIVSIAIAILFFFVGRGLWKTKNWARITAIVISVLSIIGAIMGMVQGDIGGNIISLIIHLIIGGYLLFSKSVKKSFK